MEEKAERRRHRAEENMGEQLLVAAAAVELVNEMDRTARHGAKERACSASQPLTRVFHPLPTPPWYATAYMLRVDF